MRAGGVEILSEARDELTEGVRFYRAREPEIAAAFLREVRAALQLLGERPELGAPWDEDGVDPEIRRFPLRRFPYVIVYVPGPPVVVLAVAHARQRPGYWRSRTRNLR